MSQPPPRGILLAPQSFPLSLLIALLDRMLTKTTAEELAGRIRWLSGWNR